MLSESWLAKSVKYRSVQFDWKPETSWMDREASGSQVATIMRPNLKKRICGLRDIRGGDSHIYIQTMNQRSSVDGRTNRRENSDGVLKVKIFYSILVLFQFPFFFLSYFIFQLCVFFDWPQTPCNWLNRKYLSLLSVLLLC